MYSLIYSELALKQLKKLDKETQARILAVLERCHILPYHHVKKLVSLPYFRLRVGDYRVILEIKEERLIVYVIEVGHRKNIYDKY